MMVICSEDLDVQLVDKDSLSTKISETKIGTRKLEVGENETPLHGDYKQPINPMLLALLMAHRLLLHKLH